MASFKFLLSDYVKKSGEQSIELQVIIKSRPISRNTGFSVKIKDWNAGMERVKASNKNFTEINDALSRIKTDAEREFALVTATGKKANAVEIAERTFATHDFYEFAQQRINEMTADTQIRTRARYNTWLAGLKEHSPTLSFEEITPEFIESYRQYLKKRGNKHNTIVGRLSTMRAVMYAAPVHLRGDVFNRVKIGTFHAAENKIPLTVQDITTLWNYQPRNPSESLTRDCFLFSYYTAGMRIGDVIQLQWADLTDHHIIYQEGKKRHLGKSKLFIPINAYAQELIDRQPKTGKYVFGELKAKTAAAITKEVESRETMMNDNLFKISVHSRIGKHITSKLARDTFADIANKRSNRDVYSISKAMGHSGIKVTELYLGNDQSAIDELLDTVYQ